MGFSANTNQHPVSGGALYRLEGNRRLGCVSSRLGQGWLLHGFFALSSNQCGCGCTPTSGNFLGVGCSDSNTAADRRIGSRGLGPNGRVNTFTGQFPFFRTPTRRPPGSVARRVQVHVDDLEPTGGPGAPRYFAEKVMIAPDEATAGNGKNNASYRELSASIDRGEWTFQLAASTQREKPAVRAWQDVDPSVQIVEVQVPGEGTFLLAWQTADLGDGRWHYEYAVENINCDRSCGVVPRPDAGRHDRHQHRIPRRRLPQRGAHRGHDWTAADWSLTAARDHLVDGRPQHQSQRQRAAMGHDLQLPLRRGRTADRGDGDDRGVASKPDRSRSSVDVPSTSGSPGEDASAPAMARPSR